jgi:parvulin-like peptidyl-prolyl cis-trans isomerase-like protein
VTAERRARTLLAVGAGLGLAVAIASVVQSRRAPSLPAGAVATVNGVPIARDDYLRALAGLAGDRKTALDAADERRVLDRLIDEELLLQHGIALGLVRRDRTLRSSLVAGTIDVVAASSASPSADEVRAYYDAHRDWFTEPGRVRVRQILVRVGDDEARAQARAEGAARRLRAGEPFADVRAALGDDEPAPLPDAALPATKLREYVGETATRSALALDAGAVADPVRSSLGFHVLQMLERQPDRVPPFDEVADSVRVELRRRADEAALRQALDRLRAAADVRVGETRP